MDISRLRIGTRLAIVFGLVITVFLVMAGVARLRIGTLNAEIGDIIGRRYATTVLANQLKGEIGDASRSMMSVLIMTDDGQVKKELARVEELMKAHEATLAAFAQRADDEASQAQLKEVAALRDKFVPAQAAFVKMVAEGNKEEAQLKYLFSVRAVQTRYLAALDKFVGTQHAAMEAAGSASAVQAERTGWLILGLALVATGASIVVGWWATRSITGPLTRAVAVARKVAAGDLSSRIEVRTQDETGQLMAALQEMNESLRGIVGDVRQGTESIASASMQIASGNQDLSTRTEAQAASLEQTNAAIKQLTETVRHNADNARQARELAGSASVVAGSGGEMVAQVVQTMGAIEASSRKVVDIIAVIDGIAFQTNILALNAAVEAARAGEQGRGFAVVAGEVRTLAQRSATAAREIKQLIGVSVGEVERGTELVGRAGTTMQDLVASVRHVTDIIGEIAAASQAQQQGIESVNRSIEQIDHGTQQNAALVEQAAAAAESLKTQAATLEGTVRLFQLAPGA